MISEININAFNRCCRDLRGLTKHSNLVDARFDDSASKRNDLRDSNDLLPSSAVSGSSCSSLSLAGVRSQLGQLMLWTWEVLPLEIPFS